MSQRAMSLLIFDSLPWFSLMMLLQGCSKHTLNTLEKNSRVRPKKKKKEQKPKKQKDA